jgi:hypothetical protein
LPLKHDQGEDAVKDFRSKLAIAAVIFGLGGLGGYAMASNPAQGGKIPSAAIASQTGQAAPRISTGSSGVVSAPAINAPASQALPRSARVVTGGRDD